MAETFLRSFSNRLDVISAGTQPNDRIHPIAFLVMAERQLYMDDNFPKSVEHFVNESFDYVITVCEEAKNSCPIFTGEVKQYIHLNFNDPAKSEGTEKYIFSEFRRVRDEIETVFRKFFQENLQTQF